MLQQKLIAKLALAGGIVIATAIGGAASASPGHGVGLVTITVDCPTLGGTVQIFDTPSGSGDSFFFDGTSYLVAQVSGPGFSKTFGNKVGLGTSFNCTGNGFTVDAVQS